MTLRGAKVEITGHSIIESREHHRHYHVGEDLRVLRRHQYTQWFCTGCQHLYPERQNNSTSYSGVQYLAKMNQGRKRNRQQGHGCSHWCAWEAKPSPSGPIPQKGCCSTNYWGSSWCSARSSFSCVTPTHTTLFRNGLKNITKSSIWSSIYGMELVA